MIQEGSYVQAVRIIKEWRVHFVHPLFLLYRINFSGGKLMSLSVMLQQLASGMVVSVEIFVVTLLFSLPLGLLICFGRMSKNPAIRGIVSAYISVMRGTPVNAAI